MVIRRNFIDLFAGCGGLSLGLMEAGWQGIFAIEKSPDAFNTFKHNFCRTQSRLSFNWPNWLPMVPMTTAHLLTDYQPHLVKLKGKIDLLAGGPPCQGFSSAGKRNPNDPRNQLTEEYIEIVKIIQPKYLIFENVRGFDTRFPGKEGVYSRIITEALSSIAGNSYRVYSSMVDARVFGIPQPRQRFIMIALEKDMPEMKSAPFETLLSNVFSFKECRGLNGLEVGVRDAIGDLEIRGQKLKPSVDGGHFKQINYTGLRKLTPFQALMRRTVTQDYEPNSLRLANHTAEVKARFNRILKECPRGVTLSKVHRERFGLNKQCFTPLHPSKLARTVTTLPDDMIHYKEPRILTVREQARLQSFPDWFEFLGKYTTGGHRRKNECPRYTQVGNAVPPLMAEAIGEVLLELSAL